MGTEKLYTYDDAAARVAGDEALSLWDDIILHDWESDEHWRWVVTSPTEETLDWAESTAAQGSAWPYQVEGIPARYFVPFDDCDGLVGRVLIEDEDNEQPGWLVYWGKEIDSIRYPADDEGRTFPTFAEAKAYALELVKDGTEAEA